MRLLRKNAVTFFYASYVGKTMSSVGNVKSGENILSYSAPICLSGNISSAKGEVSVAMFGTSLDYDKTIVLENCPFDENAILWVDCTPDENRKHDYIVKRIGVGLNETVVAIKRVDVS